MILKFTDRGWPILTAAWAAMWPPTTPTTRETQLSYFGGADTQPAVTWMVVLPVGQAAFEKFLHDNTDSAGICDITSLQRPA